MPKVTYIESDGTENIFEVQSGVSVMAAAVENGLTSIAADCGGGMACATCHIYVDDSWLDRVPEADIMESAMLDCVAADRSANSRLSCQIDVSDKIDGLVVRIPSTQY